MPSDNVAPSDEVLLKRAASGDSAAFQQLVERYHSLVHTMAYGRTRHRETAEDLAQEVFLRVYLALGRIAIPDHFPGWLVRVTHNLATDWSRRGATRSKLVQMVPMDEAHLEVAQPDGKDGRTMKPSSGNEWALDEAIFNLPQTQRDIVLLHYTEELTQKEIAERLGIHPSTVGRLLKQAIASMRGSMEAMLRQNGRVLRPARSATVRTVALVGAMSTLGLEAKAALLEAAGGSAYVAAMASTPACAVATAASPHGISLLPILKAGWRFMLSGKGLITLVTVSGLVGTTMLIHQHNGQAASPAQPSARVAVAAPVQATSSGTAMTAQVAAPAAPAASRELPFPADRSLGRLFIQDENLVEDLDEIYYWLGPDNEWEYFTEARGTVAIPPGKRVHLAVGPEGVRDLSPLRNLPPGAIYYLTFSNRKVVEGTGTIVTDEALQHVAQLNGLRHLGLTRGEISAKGLAQIRNMRTVETLSMPATVDAERLAVACSMPWLKALYINSVTRLSNQDLQMLTRLPGLEKLALCGKDHFTADGFAFLPHLKRLRYLALNCSVPVTADGMKYVARAPSLRTIWLDGLQFGDSGLADLAKSQSIQTLKILDNHTITNAGLAYLPQMISLRNLDLSNRPGTRSNIRDEGLVHLRGVKQLESFRLMNCEFTDRGLGYLGQLPNLKTLEIPRGYSPDNIVYTAEGVKALAGLSRLEELSLAGKAIDDRAMESVGRLTSLKKLWLVGGTIGNEGLAKLAALQNMEYLDIQCAIPRGQEHSPHNLSIGGMAVLNQLPRLKHLSIGTVVRDGATLNLAGLKQLEWLFLGLPGNQSLGDADLACLSGLTNLKDLQLNTRGGISDAGMQHLAPLVNLTRLTIGGGGITDAGLKHLGGMSKLCDLRVKGRFTDQGLSAFDGLRNLGGLEIDSGGSLSEAAVRALWGRLPQIVRLEAGVSRPAPLVAAGQPAKK